MQFANHTVKACTLPLTTHRETSLLKATHRETSLLKASHRETSLIKASHREFSLLKATHRETSLLKASHRKTSLLKATHRESMQFAQHTEQCSRGELFRPDRASCSVPTGRAVARDAADSRRKK